MSYQLDHRQLADEMEIFFIDEQIGAGLPVWLPNGVFIREALEKFIKFHEASQGYQRVVSPHIAKSNLYESSGHLQSFQGNMYPAMSWPDQKESYYLRPMNCPHHHKVFAAFPRSYRDLPLRLAENGQVYRYENSGSLRGLTRARSLCQNDAHIYVAPSESLSEIEKVLDLHEFCYRALGLSGYRYRLSKQDPKRPLDFHGDRDRWIQCEEILRQALINKKLPFFEAEGEAAFYGPKIDVQMKIGPLSEESIASVQLDFNSGAKFDLKFVASSGEVAQPWIIHRAPLGSHERFVSLLLEYYDGQLPGWLCPIQLYIIPMGEQASERAEMLRQSLLQDEVRVSVDKHQGSLSKRLLFAHKLRPFAVLVLGQKEMESGEVKIQFRESQQVCSLVDIQQKLAPMLEMP